MTTYTITTMTKEAYRNYMNGYYAITKRFTVEANNAEEAEALVKAMNPDRVINEAMTETVEAYEARKAEEAEARRRADAEAEAKKAEAKAKREANEAKKAEAEGLTVAEYRAKKRKEAKIRKLEEEIAKLTAELNRLKRD
jgi:NAD(P)H-dependent flavin oxidoreductase YrpB (nitropropane dioxygenase family)